MHQEFQRRQLVHLLPERPQEHRLHGTGSFVRAEGDAGELRLGDGEGAEGAGGGPIQVLEEGGGGLPGEGGEEEDHGAAPHWGEPAGVKGQVSVQRFP